jgi:hypothetical protein
MDVDEKIDKASRFDAELSEALRAMTERTAAYAASELPWVAELRKKAEAASAAALDAARAQRLDLQLALVDGTRRRSRVSDVVHVIEQYAEAARRNGRELANKTAPHPASEKPKEAQVGD